MITLTMNGEEMDRSMVRDLELSEGRIAKMDRNWELYRRKKGKDKIFFKIGENFVKETNQKYLRYYINNVATGKKRFTRGTLAVVKGDNRTYYIRKKQWGDDVICSYSSHLFERYAERKNRKKMFPEIIGEYFTNNTYRIRLYESADGKNRVYAANEGILLCVVSNKICQFRTFVSYEMLKGTQKVAYDKVKSHLDNIGELFKEGFKGDIDVETFVKYCCMATESLSAECGEIYKQYFE